MKKITITFLLFITIAITSKAQDPHYEYEQIADSLFGLLDTSYITTGYHADRGIFFYNHKGFDGEASSESLQHYGMFKSFIAGIYTSAISEAHKPNDYADWEDDLQSILHSGKTPLLFMHYEYQQFLEDSVTLFQYINLINGRLHDVAGSAGNAYTTESLVAIAAYKNKIFDTLNTVFRLSSDFVLGNTGKTIQLLEMDWDNGLGYQAFTLNEDIAVEWLDFGEKTVTLKVTYTDATVVYAKFKLSLIDTQENSSAEKLANGAPGYDAIPDERIYIQSGRSQNLGAMMEIEYGCGNHAITKPLIVVEGFNPAEFYDNPRGLVYRDFFLSIRNFESRDFTNEFPLFTQLQEEGYDIVYIDFDQGAGDLRENAYVVMAVIDWVNEQKANNNSEEPNVLLGISMGGVVGRLALLYMEDESPNTHDVSHYISFDSPHLGANVPVGFQFMIEHLYYSETAGIIRVRDFVPELVDAHNVLGYQGTKQLLRYSTVQARQDQSNDNIFNKRSWFTSQNEYLTNGNALINASHSSILSELNTLGMPEETIENIGIANGNSDGDNQGFAPLANIFSAFCDSTGACLQVSWFNFNALTNSKKAAFC
jgi:pimeloyl-ACP methyl ester carboxylesterase